MTLTRGGDRRTIREHEEKQGMLQLSLKPHTENAAVGRMCSYTENFKRTSKGRTPTSLK